MNLYDLYWSSTSAQTRTGTTAEQIRSLEERLERLALVNQALVELVLQKLGVTESEFLEIIRELDARDGIQDGRISPAVTNCEKCNRPYSTKFNKCLYCGYVRAEATGDKNINQNS